MRLLLVNAVDTLAVSLLLYLLVKFSDRRRRKGLSYPPGPPSWPIIGNFFDTPKDKPWIGYTNLSKKYGRCDILGTTIQLNRASPGDVIYLRSFSQVIVVLSSFSAIKDLLEKRGEYYSDRPRMPIVEMYVLWRLQLPMGRSLTVLRMDLEWMVNRVGFCDTWRKERKILDGSLRPGAIMSYRRVIQENTRELLVQLCANPKDFDYRIKL